jgi:hypothetical protein
MKWGFQRVGLANRNEFIFRHFFQENAFKHSLTMFSKVFFLLESHFCDALPRLGCLPMYWPVGCESTRETRVIFPAVYEGKRKPADTARTKL